MGQTIQWSKTNRIVSVTAPLTLVFFIFYFFFIFIYQLQLGYLIYHFFVKNSIFWRMHVSCNISYSSFLFQPKVSVSSNVFFAASGLFISLEFRVEPLLFCKELFIVPIISFQFGGGSGGCFLPRYWASSCLLDDKDPV